MKRILIIGLIGLCISSCKTPLTVPIVERNTISISQPNVEYIGTRNLTKSNMFFKNLGSDLEIWQLAFDKQATYFSNIDLDELASYKSQHRYISFIDVQKHIYRCFDAVEDNEGLEVGGWIVAGLTVFTLVPVYVPMLCVADKNVCEITLKGEYNIIVYDTQKKEVAFTVPIAIDIVDRYKGQYNHKSTNKPEVDKYYQIILQNEFINAYEKINQRINIL
ncbi:MAG: hypothetical protein MJZ84_04355 [Paludibacteraceae bacterium]|nr:hypothetical protein [Paludibacteraceae bacterium]